MKPDYHLCDKCGDKCPERPIWVFIDRKMDAAGSMEDVGMTVDLCGKCAIAYLRSVVESRDAESHQRSKFLEWVKRKKP